MTFARGDTVTTTNFPGVACWYVEESDRYPNHTIVVMVGDDYRHHVPTSSLTAVEEDEFCGGCGQVGCGHG